MVLLSVSLSGIMACCIHGKYHPNVSGTSPLAYFTNVLVRCGAAVSEIMV